MYRIKIALIILLIFYVPVVAQFNLEWSSNPTESSNTMGWVDFKKSGDNWG